MWVPRVPVWLWWTISVVVGFGCAWLSESGFQPTAFWSLKTLWAALAAGIGDIFVFWISALGYDPFKTGLAKYILTSSAIAFAVILIWVALKF